MVAFVEIAGRRVGSGYPCFVIAEAGVNHNGEMAIAKHLVDLALEAGADAVKFQTFKAEKLAIKSAPKAKYQQQATGESESQFEMLQRLELSQEMYLELSSYCLDRKILFMSTPFDEGSADLLDDLGVPVFKVGSGDLTNLPLLTHIGFKGKPVILSTGMSGLLEVGHAVNTIEATGNDQIILLHCVSNYPADPKDVNLRAMNTMATAFQVPVGYSDHTVGSEAALAAVALGACVVEKHFTFDRNAPGPDHQASVEPEGLASLVKGIRTVESLLGNGRKEPVESEANTALVARKSLVSALDIPVGTKITREHIAIMRPGNGLSPAMLPYLIGLTVNKDIEAGTLLKMEMFS